MTGVHLGIVGGGIGGLSAAIALARLDSVGRVTVYERTPASRTKEAVVGRGAALLLWANAVNALSSLGLRAEIAEAGAVIETTRVRTSSGGTLADLPIREWSEPHGAPSVVIRRPVLVDILTKALPSKVKVERGATLVHYTHSRPDEKARAELTFESGRKARADGVVGADGINSVVRAQLFEKDSVRLAGYDAWVGITPHTPASLAKGLALATIGHGPRFWTAILRDGAAFWYATLTRERSRLVTDRASLVEAFAGWPDPTCELLESTPEREIIRTTIRDRLPRAVWGDGPVTLLGDAAHPSTPDLGQGACQAIESATVLGSAMGVALARGDSIADGFRHYERQRIQRTSTISRLCWMTSQSSTLEGPLACELRNAAIRLALPAVARSSLRWIFDGPTPTADQAG